MARRPVYGYHKTSGQARTTVNGKRISLGTHGSPKSKARYAQIIAEWEAARTGRSPVARLDLTVSRLAYLFLKHADKEYRRDGKPTGEAANFRYALRSMNSMFHGVRVVDFGPRKLKQLQEHLVNEGLALVTINGWIGRIQQVFTWGVSEELIPVQIAHALRAVRGLRAGKTAARLPKPKGVVSEAHIAAVKPFVTKPIWAMIQFMFLTGCRPSECCAMKWSEIDTQVEANNGSWHYCPVHHKNSHRGHKRIIVIGPLGQQVLNSLRDMSRSDYVFDPRTGVEEFLLKSYRKGAKVRKTQECYSKHSLNSSVRKACDKAKIPRWSPGQLRKTRATLVRKQADLETAQMLLGHANKATTEKYYAAVDLERAETNAMQFG